MNKIYIDRDKELNSKRLLKILRHHWETVLPELRMARGYYDGTGQQIMRRTYEDPSKPNNRVVKNYCKSCVENFRGYITGNPVTYAAHDADKDISNLLDVLQANDYQNSDSE